MRATNATTTDRRVVVDAREVSLHPRARRVDGGRQGCEGVQPERSRLAVAYHVRVIRVLRFELRHGLGDEDVHQGRLVQGVEQGEADNQEEDDDVLAARVRRYSQTGLSARRRVGGGNRAFGMTADRPTDTDKESSQSSRLRPFGGSATENDKKIGLNAGVRAKRKRAPRRGTSAMRGTHMKVTVLPVDRRARCSPSCTGSSRGCPRSRSRSGETIPTTSLRRWLWFL